MARIREVFEVLGGIALGAGTMYFLDPQRGRRRRAMVRDKTNHAVNMVGREIGKASRDLRNRTRGLVAEARSTIRPEQPQGDDTLQERVRSVIGHVASRPRDVQVTVRNGVVTLKGALSAKECARLSRKVEKIPGVQELRDKLSATDAENGANSNGKVSALVGGNKWARPTGIALASTAAGMLATYGARRAMSK